MFSCLYNQELVELINEGSKGHYEQYYIDWIENDENYLYTWPETRKEKLLLGKKHRFITQLIAKVGINYDIWRYPRLEYFSLLLKEDLWLFIWFRFVQTV